MYTCIHEHFTCVNSGTVPMYTRLLYTCTHMCYTHGTLHRYTQVMYTCTLNIISCGLVYNCRYPQYTLPAQDERYPESDLLEALQLTVEEADKCQMVAQQLCSSQDKVT